MALDKLMQDLVEDTMKTLQAAPFTHDTVVRLSPRRMRALHLASQQRIQGMFNGKTITLQEDSDAPELSDEIALVTRTDTPDDITTEAELVEFAAWKASRAR